MSGTGRSNLRVNGRGADVNWFKGGENIFSYRQWFRTMNSVNERFDLSTTSSSTPTYGEKVTFEADKRGDQLGKMELIFSRAALVGGATPSFNDWEGYSTIDRVEYIYNNKLVYRSYGDQMHKELVQKKSQEERDAMGEAQFGGKTLAERITNGTISYIWYCDLMVPWDHIRKQIPMIALPNKLTVDVYFKKLSECARGSPTSCTINSVKLRAHYIHIPQVMRSNLFNQVNSTVNGVAIKIATEEHQLKDPIASGFSGEHRIRLRNIKNAVFVTDLLLRPQAAVDSSATLDLWDFRLCDRFWFEDNGTRITVKTEMNDTATAPKYGLYSDNIRMHPLGEVGQNIHSFAFCEKELVEKSEDDCWGSRNFSRYNNPEIVLEFDSATSVAQYVDIWADIHNLLIFQKGDFRRYLL
jgi:hypothetical protein